MPDWPTSGTLLDRVRAADQTAWQRLVHLYTPLVRYWCQQGGAKGIDAEDVSQEVFQALSANVSQFEVRPGGTFRAWLRGITRHKLMDYHGRRDGQPAAAGGTDAHLRLSQVPEAESTDGDDPPSVVSELYHRALELVQSEFEPRTWQAFWRVAVDGQTVADIAADMGISTAAIRQAKSRVLRRLKEEVGDLIA